MSNLPVSQKSHNERSLARLRSLAHLMDDQFEVPLIRVRIGLDPILGLIPGGGDWVSWAVSVYILWEAMKLGVPVKTLLRMGWNLTLDLVAGYIPILGDLADVVIKANRKNVDLVFVHFQAHTDPLAPGHVIIGYTPREMAPREKFLLYVLGLGMMLVLLVLASVPILILYWFFS